MGGSKNGDAYKIDDRVVYKSNGICRIAGVEDRKFAGEVRRYYVLESVFDGHSTWYVPVDSPELVASMNRVLSADEINELIDASVGFADPWIDDYKERAEKFNSIIKGCDRAEVLALFKTLALRKADAESRRRKLYVGDERALHNAEKIITEEFSYVLGIPKNEVVGYIVARLGGGK